jgi:hypothetical protein
MLESQSTFDRSWVGVGWEVPPLKPARAQRRAGKLVDGRGVGGVGVGFGGGVGGVGRATCALRGAARAA